MRPVMKTNAFWALYMSLDMRDAVVEGVQRLAPTRMRQALGKVVMINLDLEGMGQNTPGSVQRAVFE